MTPGQRILVIRPSALGDVAQAVPIVRALSRRLPGSQIGWLVGSAFAGLLEGLPFLHSLHRFDRSKTRGLRNFIAGRRVVAQLVAGLREHQYQASIDFQGLMRSAWFGKMSRAGERWGFAPGRELSHIFYTNRVPAITEQIHAVDRVIALAAAALGCDVSELTGEVASDSGMDSTPAELSAAKNKVAEAGVDPARFVVLGPGANWVSKRWPPALFGELAARLKAETGLQTVVAGAPSDQVIADAVVAASDGAAVSLAGKTNLRELAALLHCASLVVSNDSGPMHIAALQGTPMVALFGPTRPELTGPWRRPQDVIRPANAPEDHRSYRRITDDSVMRGISVDEVTDASLARLA